MLLSLFLLALLPSSRGSCEESCKINVSEDDNALAYAGSLSIATNCTIDVVDACKIDPNCVTTTNSFRIVMSDVVMNYTHYITQQCTETPVDFVPCDEYANSYPFFYGTLTMYLDQCLQVVGSVPTDPPVKKDPTDAPEEKVTEAAKGDDKTYAVEKKATDPPGNGAQGRSYGLWGMVALITVTLVWGVLVH